MAIYKVKVNVNDQCYMSKLKTFEFFWYLIPPNHPHIFRIKYLVISELPPNFHKWIVIQLPLIFITFSLTYTRTIAATLRLTFIPSIPCHHPLSTGLTTATPGAPWT